MTTLSICLGRTDGTRLTAISSALPKPGPCAYLRACYVPAEEKADQPPVGASGRSRPRRRSWRPSSAELQEAGHDGRPL